MILQLNYFTNRKKFCYCVRYCVKYNYYLKWYNVHKTIRQDNYTKQIRQCNKNLKGYSSQNNELAKSAPAV